jgi:poly-gamma-glutamate capsule biosynthesis protein CapA/YwtB (metallophosphatase superfamily)
MATGEPARRERWNPWLPAFALALASFAGSLAALAYVVTDGRHDPAAAAAASDQPPNDSRGSATHAPLLFAGSLPSGLADPLLLPAEASQQPDLTFQVTADGTGTPHRYFVPVAAIGAGVDALSRAQLADLGNGRITNWKDVGGVAGKVTFAVGGPPEDQAEILNYFGNPPIVKRFATYDELRAAMTWDSGMLALIPLSEVRPGQMAIAVDSVDLVRGRGASAVWPFTERVAVTASTERGRQALPALQDSLSAQLPAVTRVVATGDILQSRCSLTAIKATGDWAAALRGPVGEYLASAALALGSLDGSITDFATPYGCVETTNLTSPAQVIQALTIAGIDEVTVATNHVFDCGQSGPCGSRAFTRTLELLHQAGIKTTGGGNNLDEALAPEIFDVNGVKFGVLGFDDIAAEDLEATASEPGTAPLDDSYQDEKNARPQEPAFYKPAEMLDLTHFEAAIRKLKQEADVVIVQVQTGYEDTHEASPRSIKALRAAAAAGADLVVGNQGHHVQPVEVIGNTWISYALGNFIFDQVHTPDHTEGYLLEASFWGKQLANVRMVPYHIIGQYKPTFVDGAVRAKILTDVMNGTATLPPQR